VELDDQLYNVALCSVLASRSQYLEKLFPVYTVERL